MPRFASGEGRSSATSIWDLRQKDNKEVNDPQRPLRKLSRHCRLALVRHLRIAYPEMRNVILSVLLVVLGVQTWAPACSLHCSSMATRCHGSMPGMAQCHAMPPTHGNHGVDRKAPPALPGCSSPACRRDETLLQRRATCETEPPLALVSLGARALFPFKVAGVWRTRSYREKEISPQSSALITILRI